MKRISKLIVFAAISAVALSKQTAIAQEKILTLLTFGDSITAGLIKTTNGGAEADCPVGVMEGDSFSGSGNQRCFGQGAEGVGGYQPELKNSFEDFGYDVSIYNYGYSGATTAQMTEQIDGDLNERPGTDYVLLMGGVNDAFNGIGVSSVDFNMQEMVNKVCNKGMRPVLATATKYYLDGSGVNNFIRAYNVEFRKITTASSNCSVINVEQYDALKTDEENYGDDGLHLSEMGNSVMANVWFTTMGLADLTIKHTVMGVLPSIISLLLDNSE